jgi:hypothetical protein
MGTLRLLAETLVARPDEAVNDLGRVRCEVRVSAEIGGDQCERLGLSLSFKFHEIPRVEP